MSEPEVYRCFLAVEISETVRQHMQELQGLLCRSKAKLRCPPPEAMHLTLVFLGSVFPDEVPRLCDMMDGVGQFQSPFSFAAAGVDVFGPPGHPRIVWAGIKNCPPLIRVQQVLAAGSSRLGYALEDRPFVPHLTLARVQSLGNDRSLTTTLAEIKDRALGETSVSRILLMRSKLDSISDRYSVLHTSYLKGLPPHAP